MMEIIFKVCIFCFIQTIQSEEQFVDRLRTERLNSVRESLVQAIGVVKDKNAVRNVYSFLYRGAFSWRGN